MTRAQIQQRTRKRAVMALNLRRRGLTLAEIGIRVGKRWSPFTPLSKERARQLVIKGQRIEDHGDMRRRPA